MRDSIAVAMSGGVDSSVAAWLLQQQGEQTVGGHHAPVYPGGAGPRPGERCHILEDIQDARAVAAQLGIPHHALTCPVPSGSGSWSPLSGRMSRAALRIPA